MFERKQQVRIGSRARLMSNQKSVRTFASKYFKKSLQRLWENRWSNVNYKLSIVEKSFFIRSFFPVTIRGWNQIFLAFHVYFTFFFHGKIIFPLNITRWNKFYLGFSCLQLYFFSMKKYSFMFNYSIATWNKFSLGFSSL